MHSTEEATDLPPFLFPGMRGCDAVIHLAAKVQSWGKWADFQEETVEGTRRTVDTAKAAGVPRFVHVSTIFANVKVKLLP